jgi:hypothetical protein
MGIDYIEVNTNAVRFSQDIDFLRKCKGAGMDSLYFSFDGLTSDVYMKTCGRTFWPPSSRRSRTAARWRSGHPGHRVSPDINIHQIGTSSTSPRRTSHG